MKLYVQPPSLRLRGSPNGPIFHNAVPQNTEVDGGSTRQIGTILWQQVATPFGAGWMAAREGTDLYLAPTRVTPPIPAQAPTPYDGHTALWLYHPVAPSVVAFTRSLPKHVSAVFVKTSEGGHWQGDNDPHVALGITGPDRVDAWVAGLGTVGFHAWCVPLGLNVALEAQRIVDVCTRPGVRSMILDVEPHSGFWRGSREAVRELMERVRSAIPAQFHIGLSIDPRPQHYAAIFPDAWRPFVDSVHPQIYWRTFGLPYSTAIGLAYQTWAKFGKPIVPVLQGNALPADIAGARRLVRAEYGTKGMSFWRHGVMGASQLAALIDSPKRRALARLNIRLEPRIDSPWLGLVNKDAVVAIAEQRVNGYQKLLDTPGWVLSAWLQEIP